MPDNKPISGVLSINKPPDMTSHDVVEQVRRLLNIKYKKRNTNLRVGHTGTLDPFATGVLLVAIGSATRLIEYSHDWNKEYETVITLGAASDTDDVTGKILKSDMQTLEIPKIAQIQQTLKHFVGIIKQVPPAYDLYPVKWTRKYVTAHRLR